MIVKLLEIRDSETFIGAMAIKMFSADPVQSWYLRKEGYPADGSSVMLMKLSDGKATNDPYEWVALKQGPRTMPYAHMFILQHFDELRDGDVVDVQVILGETTVAKRSGRLGAVHA